MEALKNGDFELLRDLINEKNADQNSRSNKRKKGDGKLIDVEATYEGDNDKTLLQIATDNGNEEAVKVITKPIWNK